MKTNHALLVLFTWLFASIAALSASERVALPTNVTPLHYKILVAPNAQKLTFDGEVTIDLKVNQPTNTVVLNAADLVLKKAKIAGIGDAKIAYDDKIQTVTLSFAKALRVGKKSLTLTYSGKILLSANGLFAMDYGTTEAPKRGLFTQFETADARRFMPCFDEPGIKTTFELSALVPKSDMAVSNTPIVTTTLKKDGMKLVRFAKTPLMSTYLLFFGVGDFERVSKSVNGVNIGIVIKRGDTAKAAYALETALKILPYYEQYFGVRYPLPKLDLIGMPGTSQFFSAMENWGAITYMDRALLVDPKTTTEADRRHIFLIIAHEMAHQWFGDLVTMSWWDDLWLNEGFAEWMNINTMAHFHPEWRAWLGATDDIEDGKRMDAKSGTHPIVQNIVDVFQADQAFDAITYQKGAAVIRMIEQYVGPTNFRNAIRAYMKKHAYRNTVSEDLWQAINAASPKPVSAIAHDFTSKSGVPLIQVSKTNAGWKLEQRVFSWDDSTPATQEWDVPIDTTKIGDKVATKTTVSRSKALEISDPNHVGIFLNSEMSGYYRVKYDDASFAKLLASFEKLPDAVQVSLIEDSRELGLAGIVPVSRFLSIAALAKPSSDHFVLTRIINGLTTIYALQRDLESQKDFEKFIVKLVHPIIARIGWTEQKDDNQSTAELRENALKILGVAKDKEIVERAFAYFNDFLKNPHSLSSELRHSVLDIVGVNADAQRFEELHKLAVSTPNMVEKQEYYAMLSQNRDSILAQKALSLSLDNATTNSFKPDIIKVVARQFPKLAFDFTVKNWDTLKPVLGSASENRFVPRNLAIDFDRASIAKLNEFAKKHFPPTAMQDTEKAKASIALNANIREKRIPEVAAWLKNSH